MKEARNTLAGRVESSFNGGAPWSVSMAKAAIDRHTKGVKSNAGWINRILIASGVLSLIIIGVKLLGQTEFEWEDVTVPTAYTPVVFAMLTAAHLYVHVLLLRSARSLYDATPTTDDSTVDPVLKDLFDDLVATGPLFLRGMVRRYATESGYLQMSKHDPTTWLHHGLAVAAFAAMIPFQFTSIWAVVGYAIAAFIIIFVNWVIGSDWSRVLSEMDGKRGHADRLKNVKIDYSRSGLGPPLVFYGFLCLALLIDAGILVAIYAIVRLLIWLVWQMIQ
jgi:hypothetical protein